MGLDKDIIVIVGYKIPFPLKNNFTNENFNWWDEKYLPMIEGWQEENFSLFRNDGADYIVFGKLVAMMDDTSDWVELKIDEINKDEIKTRFKELFGDYLNAEFFGEPKLAIFGHWG